MSAACLAMVAAVTVQACGSQTDEATDVHGTSAAAPAEIFTELGQRVEKISFATSIEHLADALPATGTDPGRELEGVLVGRVTGANEGAAFAHRPDTEGEEAPDGVPVDWDADDVAWRDATVTVEVEHIWSTVIPPDTANLQLKIPVAGDLPPQEYVEGLAGLGRIVAVLSSTDHDSPIPGRHSVLWEATALGTVSANGNLSFPAMSQKEAAAFLGKLTTVQALEQAAQTG